MILHRLPRHSIHAVFQSGTALYLSTQLVKLEPDSAAAVQEQAGQQMQEQQARLESLRWTLADARRLVSAVGAVESYGSSKTALQVCIVASHWSATLCVASTASAGVHVADHGGVHPWFV